MSTAVFGALGFRAQSGRMVKQGEDGSVSFHLGNGYIGADVAMDAEEFFQAKRDAELGRWRWPENPEWIVYPARDGYRGECDLLVINEVWGAAAEYTRADDEGSPRSATDAASAARAYFEAHPERKPWHDAKIGEIWAFTLLHDPHECPWVRVDGDHEWASSEDIVNRISIDNPQIVSGRRIWPVDEGAPGQLHVASSQAGFASIREGL